MTDYQKTQIMKLRAEGLGYGKIAQRLGISLNTVKSYCRRNNVNGDIVSIDVVVPAFSGEVTQCENCSSIQQISKQKKKRFCCDACRNKWWNSHLDQVKKKPPTILPVPTAVRCSMYMETTAENIAVTNAISLTDLEVAIMSNAEFRNEKLYQTTMSMARKMLDESIISEEEYCQIDMIFLEKYSPIFGTLFSGITLTSGKKRAIYSVGKE